MTEPYKYRPTNPRRGRKRTERKPYYGCTPRAETKRRGYKTFHDHPLFSRWVSMMQRCYNPNHVRYHRYGGRGIGVVPRWWNFWNFVDDMYSKYLSLPPEKSRLRKDRYTLSRPKHDKDYGPLNCEWELPGVHYSRPRPPRAPRPKLQKKAA